MRVFPTVSETFVILNIVEAIKAGFQVKIIPDIIDKKLEASQPHLVREYNLEDKIVSASYPKKKIIRYKKALTYLFNPMVCYYFIKYCFLKKEVSLKHLFTIQFYKQFKENTLFHVHFANREKPLFDLKKIGFLKSKVIITAHGFDIHKLSQKNAADINKLASNVTVNTRYLKDKSIQKGINSTLIKVIPIGIDSNLFTLNDNQTTVKKEKLSLISVGRLIPLKGQIYGIKAIKLLIDKGYKLEYTIIGEGKDQKKLEEYSKKHKMQDAVTIKPFQEQKVLKKMLQESDIFLFPSTNDTTGRREAFGVVSLEAQAMGLPVIGFKSGGFPETIVEGKTGFTVNDEDIQAMADKIEALLLNKDLLKKMGYNAQTNIKDNFTIERTTGQYLKLYR